VVNACALPPLLEPRISPSTVVTWLAQVVLSSTRRS
jgi:hypothetical protein